MITIQAWPVYVLADCEGRTSKVVGWFDSRKAADAFARTDECRRQQQAELYGDSANGRVGQPITIESARLGRILDLITQARDLADQKVVCDAKFSPDCTGCNLLDLLNLALEHLTSAAKDTP